MSTDHALFQEAQELVSLLKRGEALDTQVVISRIHELIRQGQFSIEDLGLSWDQLVQMSKRARQFRTMSIL